MGRYKDVRVRVLNNSRTRLSELEPACVRSRIWSFHAPATDGVYVHANMPAWVPAATTVHWKPQSAGSGSTRQQGHCEQTFDRDRRMTHLECECSYIRREEEEEKEEEKEEEEEEEQEHEKGEIDGEEEKVEEEEEEEQEEQEENEEEEEEEEEA